MKIKLLFLFAIFYTNNIFCQTGDNFDKACSMLLSIITNLDKAISNINDKEKLRQIERVLGDIDEDNEAILNQKKKFLNFLNFDTSKKIENKNHHLQSIAGEIRAKIFNLKKNVHSLHTSISRVGEYDVADIIHSLPQPIESNGVVWYSLSSYLLYDVNVNNFNEYRKYFITKTTASIATSKSISQEIRKSRKLISDKLKRM